MILVDGGHWRAQGGADKNEEYPYPQHYLAKSLSKL